MPLLDFNKPTKLRNSQDHAAMHSSDSGVAGTFVPNMSEEDMYRWKAKHVNKGKPNARIEIKKTVGHANITRPSAQIVIIVALDGWDGFKSDVISKAGLPGYQWQYTETKGLNVRMSMNGPLYMTFEEFAEVSQVIEEARQILVETKP